MIDKKLCHKHGACVHPISYIDKQYIRKKEYSGCKCVPFVLINKLYLRYSILMGKGIDWQTAGNYFVICHTLYFSHTFNCLCQNHPHKTFYKIIIHHSKPKSNELHIVDEISPLPAFNLTNSYKTLHSLAFFSLHCVLIQYCMHPR